MSSKNKKSLRRNPELLRGTKVIVTKTIPSTGFGEIKIEGLRRPKKARSTNGEIHSGERARIYDYSSSKRIFTVSPIRKNK